MTGCGKCGLYSRSLGRCVNGKVFPKTMKSARSMAQFMGVGYLCGKSPVTVKFVQELHGAKPAGQ